MSGQSDWASAGPATAHVASIVTEGSGENGGAAAEGWSQGDPWCGKIAAKKTVV